VHPRARFSISTKTFFKGEPHVRKWVAEQLNPGSVFFDVGAHHGWVSMWALTLNGEKRAVYSFEPSPANLSILNLHKKINSFSNWTIIPKAVCDEAVEDREFFLIDSGDSPMNSLTNGIPGTKLMEGREINEISIQTVTLDSFCREVDVKPNLVKIDVEGAELLVLYGAKNLMSESFPTIILSVHPYWLPHDQSLHQIVEWIEGFGYTIFDSSDHRVTSLQSGEYLCLPPN